MQGLSKESKAGQPTKYNKDIAAEICGQLARGISLRTVCRADDMPCTATIYNWFNEHPEFLERYAKAKEDSADALIEDMLDIADDGSNDYMDKLNSEGEKVGTVFNAEHVQRSKLRVDVRKWAASKLKPKKYGERVTQDHTGSVTIAGILDSIDGASKGLPIDE